MGDKRDNKKREQDDLTSERIDKNKSNMIEALDKAFGIVSKACEMVGISRQTHYRWMKEDEEYKDQVDDIQDVALDFAENALLKQIQQGNTAATIFYLKTRGKKRGYIEQAGVSTERIKPPQVTFIKRGKKK